MKSADCIRGLAGHSNGAISWKEERTALTGKGRSICVLVCVFALFLPSSRSYLQLYASCVTRYPSFLATNVCACVIFRHNVMYLKLTPRSQPTLEDNLIRILLSNKFVPKCNTCTYWPQLARGLGDDSSPSVLHPSSRSDIIGHLLCSRGRARGGGGMRKGWRRRGRRRGGEERVCVCARARARMSGGGAGRLLRRA